MRLWLSSCITMALLPALARPALCADWPRFRGPNGSGVGESKALPANFGPGKNVDWKAEVPFGRSSPIVAGGRLFVTAAEGENLITLAFDAPTGKQLWRREVKRAREHKIYKSNDAASPTPASDGENVFVFFPDFGLISYTAAGKERWRHPLGPFDNFYGMASSPVVHGSTLLLLCDQSKGSFLLALDKETGKKKWRTERPATADGWAAPVVHQDQILAVGTSRVDSYHLSTGESRWWIPVSSHGSMGTPVIHGESLLVAAAGSDQPMFPAYASVAADLDKDKDGKLAFEECKDQKDWVEHFGWVDLNRDLFIDEKEWETARSFGVGLYGAISIPMGGKGALPPDAVAWRVKRGVSYVSSPVLYGGAFYMVKDGGIVSSIDPKTGAIIKQARIEQAPGQYFASLVAADGKIFLANENGKITVLRAAPEWSVISINDLAEEIFATPAISGGRLFVRTRSSLYSFSAKE